jgi:hypothetical protein
LQGRIIRLQLHDTLSLLANLVIIYSATTSRVSGLNP